MIHIVVTVVLVILQITLPRKYGAVPLLIAALHTSYAAQVIPSFSTARIIILVGIVRAACSGHLNFSPRSRIDQLFIPWTLIVMVSAFAHPAIYDNPYTLRMKMIVDIVGAFIYSRSYITSMEDFKIFCKSLAITIIPLAIGMTLEKLSGGNNPYGLIGGSPRSLTRDGEIRAQGPFGTPILSGTVGAITVPLLVMFYRENKNLARIGIVACLVIIVVSASSTPIGCLLLSCMFIAMFRYSEKLKTIVVITIVGVLMLQLVRERPIWYLIALVDFVGGSTGWHRSYLIDMAIEHLDEWWLIGTHYTRHWMPYGLPSVPHHSDLTNYYLHMGVNCGIFLVLILIMLIWRTFGKIVVLYRLSSTREEHFKIWCMGSLLCTHAIAFLTISYFDQVYIFFYLLLAVVSSLTEKQELSSFEPVMPEEAIQNKY